MIMNRNCSRAQIRLRTLLCVFLFIAAGIVVICATGIGEREHCAGFGWYVATQASKIALWVIDRTANGEKAGILRRAR
jgi:hypothetical protein